MKPSLNACSQALKLLKPKLSRKEYFKILGVPECYTSKTRYWDGNYNILDWDKRNPNERVNAEIIADYAINTNQTVWKVWNEYKTSNSSEGDGQSV